MILWSLDAGIWETRSASAEAVFQSNQGNYQSLFAERWAEGRLQAQDSPHCSLLIAYQERVTRALPVVAWRVTDTPGAHSPHSCSFALSLYSRGWGQLRGSSWPCSEKHRGPLCTRKPIWESVELKLVKEIQGPHILKTVWQSLRVLGIQDRTHPHLRHSCPCAIKMGKGHFIKWKWIGLIFALFLLYWFWEEVSPCSPR